MKTNTFTDALAVVFTALAADATTPDRLLRLPAGLGHEVLVTSTLHAVESMDKGGFRLDLTALAVDAHLSLDARLAIRRFRSSRPPGRWGRGGGSRSTRQPTDEDLRPVRATRSTRTTGTPLIA